jgi:hypothetical protein
MYMIYNNIFTILSALQLYDYCLVIFLCSADVFPGEDEEELKQRLAVQYADLAQRLNNHINQSIKFSWSDMFELDAADGGHSRADAILFGHIAQALSHPSTTDLIKNQPLLLEYFQKLASNYFGNKSHSSIPDVWEVKTINYFIRCNSNRRIFIDIIGKAPRKSFPKYPYS